MREILAIAGAILTAGATIPYCVDIIRKRTKPNIVTWLTWTALTGVACGAAFAAHEYRTGIFVLGSTIGTALVIVLGLRHGIAKFSLFDILCQLGAIAGLVLWLVFNSPTIGIVVPVTIDFVGLLPTLRHAWLKPAEETWQTYGLDVIAPALTLLSLVTFNVISVLYPAYLFIADGILVVVIVGRRMKFGLSLWQSRPISVK